MRKSKFQFSNPIIEHINFDRCTSDEPPKKDFQYKIDNSIEIRQSQSQNLAKVYLALKIGDSSDESPFKLNITMSAKFKWGDDVETDKADLLLSKNAPALLLSYARPMISLILSQSGLPNFNIPFVDFTGKFSEDE